MIERLKNVRYVCVTVDVWTSYNRSFVGISVHYINPHTLERQSFPVRCERVKVAIDNIIIKAILEKTFKDLRIDDKIVAVITDNAPNFIAALRNYRLEFLLKDQVAIDEDEDEDERESDIEEEQIQIIAENEFEDEFEEDAQSHIEDEVASENEDEGANNLTTQTNHANTKVAGKTYFHEMLDDFVPRHIRCSAHTLSLLANDAFKIKNKKLLFRMEACFAKLANLYHKSTSPASHVMIENILGKQIIRPNATRWNSLFDSLEDILRHDREKLNHAMDSLLVIRFTKTEFELMNEYVMILKTIAVPLDVLQSSNVFFGRFLPTLRSIETNLTGLSTSTDIKICKLLVKFLLERLRLRFKEYFESGNFDDFTDNMKLAFIAMISHPHFKGNFLNDDDEYQLAEDILTKEIQKLIDKEEASQQIQEQNVQNQNKADSNGFRIRRHISTVSRARQLARSYLESQTSENEFDLDQLNESPNKYVKKIFLLHNTPLCSQAPVERLFSFAKLILTPNRSSLSDSLFEKLLILEQFME